MCYSIFLLSYQTNSTVNTVVIIAANASLVVTGKPKPLLLSTRINSLLTLSIKTAGRKAIGETGKRLQLNADLWADKEGVQPCFQAEVVRSGTGAGDTSIAAYLTAVLRGYAPAECTAFAAAEGACCVTTYDALSGLRSIEELAIKISSGWKTGS